MAIAQGPAGPAGPGGVSRGLEQRQARVEQRAAEETRCRLADAVELSHDAIISETHDGLIASWNAGAERLFGYTAEEVIGHPISLLVPPEYADESPAYDRADPPRRADRAR